MISREWQRISLLDQQQALGYSFGSANSSQDL